MNWMKPSLISNCETDNDFHLVTGKSVKNINKIGTLNNGNYDTSGLLESFSSLSLSSIKYRLDCQEANVILEQCSNAYIAEYLGKTCVDKLIVLCKNMLLKEKDDENFDKNQFFIFCRKYD